jgi:hypothetical protein
MHWTAALAIISSLLGPSIALSDDLPRALVGRWFEVVGPGSECSDDGSQIEIVRTDTKLQVGGRSGDWICTWSEGRMISRTTERSSFGGGVTVFAVKSECERVDDCKYPIGATVLTHVLRKHASTQIDEQLYIGSVTDAYNGLYGRCRNKT